MNAAVQPWLARGRIPCLDGLRAVAVGAVLLDHVSRSEGLAIPEWLVRILIRGAIGVDLFFVISGFLITLLMLRERQRSGRISLRAFYTRRSLRILPAYAVYLLAVATVAALGAPGPSATEWAGLLTYTVNWQRIDLSTAWAVALTWTLAIEEQFYLLWPLLLRHLDAPPAKRLLLAYILATPLLRFAVAAALPDQLHLVGQSSLTRMDGIAMGCLLAILAFDGSLRRYRPTGRAALLVAVAAAAVLIVSLRFTAASAPYLLLMTNTLTPALFAVIVWTVINNPTTLAARVLESWPFVAMGLISYSVYLWQGLFMVPVELATSMPSWLRALQHWPLNVLVTIVAAIASYLLVERPFLRLKDRVPGAQPHRELAPPRLDRELSV